jgi:hypothetical protein
LFLLRPENGVQFVPMEVHFDTDGHVVTIPKILRYSVAPQNAKVPEPLSSQVDGFLYPWLREPRQWRTRQLDYESNFNGHTQYEGTNSLTGKFDITSEYALVWPSKASRAFCSLPHASTPPRATAAFALRSAD